MAGAEIRATIESPQHRSHVMSTAAGLSALDISRRYLFPAAALGLCIFSTLVAKPITFPGWLRGSCLRRARHTRCSMNGYVILTHQVRIPIKFWVMRSYPDLVYWIFGRRGRVREGSRVHAKESAFWGDDYYVEHSAERRQSAGSRGVFALFRLGQIFGASGETKWRHTGCDGWDVAVSSHGTTCYGSLFGFK